MYSDQTTIRMRDTDATGVLYFTEQLRMCQETFEKFLTSCGHKLQKLFSTEKLFIPIVNAQSEYLFPVFLGDILHIEMHVSHIGKSSFSLEFSCKKEGSSEEVGKVKIVHVCVDYATRKKCPIPALLLQYLEKIQ